MKLLTLAVFVCGFSLIGSDERTHSNKIFVHNAPTSTYDTAFIVESESSPAPVSSSLPEINQDPAEDATAAEIDPAPVSSSLPEINQDPAEDATAAEIDPTPSTISSSSSTSNEVTDVKTITATPVPKTFEEWQSYARKEQHQIYMGYSGAPFHRYHLKDEYRFLLALVAESFFGVQLPMIGGDYLSPFTSNQLEYAEEVITEITKLCENCSHVELLVLSIYARTQSGEEKCVPIFSLSTLHGNKFVDYNKVVHESFARWKKNSQMPPETDYVAPYDGKYCSILNETTCFNKNVTVLLDIDKVPGLGMFAKFKRVWNDYVPVIQAALSFFLLVMMFIPGANVGVLGVLVLTAGYAELGLAAIDGVRCGMDMKDQIVNGKVVSWEFASSAVCVAGTAVSAGSVITRTAVRSALSGSGKVSTSLRRATGAVHVADFGFNVGGIALPMADYFMNKREWTNVQKAQYLFGLLRFSHAAKISGFNHPVDTFHDELNEAFIKQKPQIIEKLMDKETYSNPDLKEEHQKFLEKNLKDLTLTDKPLIRDLIKFDGLVEILKTKNGKLIRREDGTYEINFGSAPIYVDPKNFMFSIRDKPGHKNGEDSPHNRAKKIVEDKKNLEAAEALAKKEILDKAIKNAKDKKKDADKSAKEANDKRELAEKATKEAEEKIELAEKATFEAEEKKKQAANEKKEQATNEKKKAS